MSILRKFLPAVFGRSTVPDLPESAPSNIAQRDDIPSDLNAEQAAKFHNVLLFLVPTEEMAATAFDDYYPGFYYALKQYEIAKTAGLEPENYNRASFASARAVAHMEHENPIIQNYHDLREKMRESISFHKDEQGYMVPENVDKEGFMDAVHEHIDLLLATKAMLETPIKDINLYKGRAIVDDSLPLKADLAENTRFGSAYHTDYLEEFLSFIEWAANHRPTANPALEEQDDLLKIVSPD